MVALTFVTTGPNPHMQQQLASSCLVECRFVCWLMLKL
ncbi:hypothetical protein NC652_039117 [Populus alba x Populus x berolinensis]|nr:hypothetical protein NC651_037824 [Populus alba x Populus x berolinensis]KAJ6856097.1 hypothetical protein NC651_037844 [Populus alba x Populus x berolinensis]KAJ6861920.1 hypothetical protein NC652_038907 [Populus alba x Populus x berolinensis]KAJ6861927.1 hypothetical protein NC652_038912 [Populus alba x Populus x berolinensis]KAJ6862177.1 hypothetical protein NC652_039117 [Populus alba x Populus x berolinensis]